jgi:DNA-binding NarL/FixJ family response regulator
MKSVLLVEDHAVFRQALALILEQDTDFEEDVQAGSLAEGRGRVNGTIDVAVIDLGLPDGDGTDLIRELREARPGVPVLALTMSQDRERHDRAFEAGAKEVLTKDISIKEVVAAVRRIGEG